MPRDPRLDIVRGWLQLTIFASHAFGSWIGVWLIHGAWGVSDSSEQFIFLSGLTLGSLFDYKLTRYGWRNATRDMLMRAARLYRTHLVVLCGFALVALTLRQTPALSDQISMLRWSYWFVHPVQASAGALALLYQPTFMDILPLFILCMLALPVFGILLARVGHWALLLPLTIYAAVALFGLRPPWLGNSQGGFNVLAWQILFMLGAWVGRAIRRGTWRIPHQRCFAALALLIVVGAAVLRLDQHGFLPWHLYEQFDAWIDKRDLAPLRIMHALSLALLVASIVPRDAVWMRARVFGVLATIGRNSLRVFCLGLFLSLACSLVFQLQPYSVWLDLLLMGGGAGLLAAYAVLVERRGGGSLASAQSPQLRSATGA
ncbi:MAG: OpgC domain-containing protein [Acetobacteraceae bacterium]